MKIMTIKMKKWLYGVALGALLIAGNVTGITIHEALSNDFWSADTEQRLSVEKLEKSGDYKEYRSKWKEKPGFGGSEIKIFKEIDEGETEAHIRWKNTRLRSFTKHPQFYIIDQNDKLITRHATNKEKMITKKYELCKRLYNSATTNMYDTAQMTYSNKPAKKDVRPVGPYVVDDWLPDELTKYSDLSARFFGTEHNAVTNVISDNEAYITSTISQTGQIDEYYNEKVNQPASLLRTYTQHITTDADHVYIEQEITENTQNDPCYNSQNTYQTQYTATFKKGRFKNEKETISKVSQRDIASWALKLVQKKKN